MMFSKATVPTHVGHLQTKILYKTRKDIKYTRNLVVLTVLVYVFIIRKHRQISTLYIHLITLQLTLLKPNV
jgi:hypothetical protein